MKKFSPFPIIFLFLCSAIFIIIVILINKAPYKIKFLIVEKELPPISKELPPIPKKPEIIPSPIPKPKPQIIIRDVSMKIELVSPNFFGDGCNISAKVSLKTNAPNGKKVHVHFRYVYYEGIVENGESHVSIEGWIPPSSDQFIVSVYDEDIGKVLVSSVNDSPGHSTSFPSSSMSRAPT